MKRAKNMKIVSYSPWKWMLKTWKTRICGYRKHEKHEFLQRLSIHVSVCTVAENRPGSWKMRAIAHEMGRTHKKCEL
jgi:hypothetical protein